MGKKGHYQAPWHRERGPRRAPYTGPENALEKRSGTTSNAKPLTNPETVAPLSRKGAEFVTGLDAKFIQETLKEAGMKPLDEHMRTQ